MKHLPNLLTLLNLFCGSVAAVLAVLNRLEWAALFFLLGVFFDFFDGLLARAMGVQSELGVQLDSLADMVTSGLVPGLVMCQMLGMSASGGWNHDGFFQHSLELTGMLPFAGLLITLGTSWRLARFNIDENQVRSFVGLPSPANALWVISLPLILMYNGSEWTNAVLLNTWVLLGLTVLSTFLLNAPIRLFALKFKSWDFRENGLKYLFLLLSAVLLATLQYLAVPLVILMYVLFSLGVREDEP
ncbi:CDP-alcohol phosphatidyltransferase family protein [Robiginitalea sp. M366]|uniref:CDP-alcohol phosphatidyltransferase family protein n=1 Tax=Robiginitalea aestuariiviva TaxID=3036903 RepID=UPI00240D98D0|nr:CDP-alcohol phosphatidyltransferase family protein [Robiginitalea aestuariiviva]MDG1572407.1 CDP-alcohol phosphatidyltransferase family protein [Robiginitalea aestuariiviva]